MAIYNLRTAKPEDDAFLREVYRSTRAAETASFGWASDAADGFIDMQYFARKGAYEIQFPQSECMVIEFNGQPAGSVILQETPDELRLVDIAVVPLFKRQGIGKSVITRLQARAAARDIPIVLHVDSGNLSAIAFYTEMHFETVEQGQIQHRMIWRRHTR